MSPEDAVPPAKDDDSRYREHIEDALQELPLTEAQIAKVAPRIDAGLSCLRGDSIHADSTIFDFRYKITAVVEHFREHGLTLSEYLQAAVKQPSLFCQSPAKLIANIEGVAEHFREHGLILSEYLQAAVKQPSLFCQSPARLIANIEGVAERFQEYGLTLKDYVDAAVKQPQLFCIPSATIIANIEGVAERFQEHGLTLSEYLQAAVKQLPLFYQSPDTIIGHVNLIIDLHRQGLAAFPRQDEAPPGRPLKPLFDWLVKHPSIFCLGDDNYTLRNIAAHVAPDGYTGAQLLRHSRKQVEGKLAEGLGHPDLAQPVPKEPAPDQGGEPGRHARNLLLRALVRAGIVKGGTLER